MFCSNCGTNLTDDSRFCRSCGKTMGVVSTGGGAAAAPARIPASAAKTGNLIWRVVGLALLLVAVVGTAWYMQQNASKPLSQSHAAQGSPQLHTTTTGDKSFTVNAGGVYYFKFQVPAGGYSASLKGRFSATGGVGNDIDAFVITEDDYVNWQSGHTVHALYNSGKATQETLNVPLPTDAGSYYLVFSNNFSLLTPKAVQVNVALAYYTR
jgi:hypothetical protein